MIKKEIRKVFRIFVMIILMFHWEAAFAQSTNGINDFSKATVILSKNLSVQEQAAVSMLLEEIEKRSLIAISPAHEVPASSMPKIFVGTISTFKENKSWPSEELLKISGDFKAEGFTIQLIKKQGRASELIIAGNDSRGLLYGIGYFLRKSTMKWHQLGVPDNINISTHPAFPLRGHQLGYRPKTNAYDGMDEKMWEQYIRDLSVFGSNAIELMPPFTDDAPNSPMFPRPQMDMMVKMTRIIDKYGLDAWIWYPLMYGDYTKSENIKKSLDESEKVFSLLPRINALFIPGGDPGHVEPKVLFKYLEKQAASLHKFHPKAEMWLSPQGFSKEWMDQFFELLKANPKWLTGLVYGPQMIMDINDFSKQVAGKYPIRRYPDITHCFDSQYPVPNWDFTFAATQNREPINPRPEAQEDIFKFAKPGSNVGFITYSEGLNDDVNKIVWSGLGWNPNTPVKEVLEDYSRYFIGGDYTHDFTQGLYNLEKNWNGPLINNSQVNVHHRIFQTMEEKASPQVRLNWRFQLALYRSYYDAYNRGRLIYETQLEERANDQLRNAPVSGVENAINAARNILNEGRSKLISQDIRARVFELAEALFQSTRMQLGTKKYFAIGSRRGANLDLIDHPLNNGIWMEDQFKRIMKIESERERLRAIDSVLNWTNPGPGGYYDDLGDLNNQPHVDMGESYKDDPAFYRTPFVGFSAYERTRNWRVSWARYMQTLHGHPLKMQYNNLDPSAQYIVKVTYVGEPVRLIADKTITIHEYVGPGKEIVPVSFEIPLKATSDGQLTLEWNMEPGKGATGRGCQIAEVWLIKKPVL